MGPEEIAHQLRGSLLQEQEDYSSNLSTYVRSLAWWSMPITPALWTGLGGALLGFANHQSSSVFSERPCSKTIRQRAPEQNAQCAPLAYWCAWPHIYTCIKYVEHTYSEYWYKVKSNGNEVINYAWEHTYITYVQHTYSEYWYKVNSNGNEVINYTWEHMYIYIIYVQHTHIQWILLQG